MRYITALILVLSLGAAASLYTPSAQAAGVYVGIGVPAPVVSIAPRYYVARPWFAPAYYGPHFWGYRHAYWGYHGFARHRWR